MNSPFILTLLFSGVAIAQSPGTFRATGNMTAPRFGHTATLLPDGKVLIAGGNRTCVIGSRCLTPEQAEIYDPATGTFTATGSMNTVSAYRDAVLLPNGKVLIAGSSVELYDPSTGEFHTAGKPATEVYVTALLNDGRVLLMGSPGAELFDPVSGAFSPVANWPGLDFRGDDPATSSYWYPVVLASGKVLLAPYDAGGCKIYDPAAGTFSPTGAPVPFLGVPHRTLLLNGAVLFTGGSDGGSGNVNRASLYDPAAGIFASNGSMSTPREEHSATLLPDGTVLAAGGAGQSNCMTPPLASAEIYDPATRGFSTTGSLASARHAHTATLLNNGQVLITGGTAFTAGCSNLVGSSINGMFSAELYTPAVLVPAPSLFSTSGDGKGQGAIWHAQTGQIASAGNPAVAGEALTMYTTSLADGSVIAPRVAIGGRLAQVLFFGPAPGYPGYYQVNFVVPDGAPSGPAVPVRLTYIGRSSNVVTIGVQ
jgi:hypothetical protein